MWRSLLSSRFASWVVGRVSIPKARQQQQELDFQRLYIVTELHKAAVLGKSVSMHQLILKSQSLEPSAVRADVEAVLQRQVIGVAEALHRELQQAGDPAPAAALMAEAHCRLQRRREREASGFSKLIRSFSRSRQPPTVKVPTPSAPPPAPGVAPAAPPAPASGLVLGGGGGTAATAAASGVSASGAVARAGGGVSQAALSEALARHIGFRLELRPSSVPHPEAGLGLFVRGEVRPGAVVAIFPGVVYGRTQLSYMPNFPKVDTDNPYLSCRYDQTIVDSKPWGRGDPGPVPYGLGGGVEVPRAQAAGPSGETGATQPEFASGTQRWWTWAGPLSSSLLFLDGRHPLALGHFVNHPGKGQSPNVLEASLDLPLDHPSLEVASRPWLRAYLPVVQPPLQYDPYSEEEEDEEEDEGEEEDGDKDGDQQVLRREANSSSSKNSNQASSSGSSRGMQLVGGSGSGRPLTHRRTGELRTGELLSPPGGVVRLLVLVATRGLRDGDEVLQNYRMNPHVVRPDWYVVHDAEAEERRWAKVKALDLGFKSRSGSAAGGGAGAKSGGHPGGG